MSIQIIANKDAIKIATEVSGGDPQFVNFYEVFGTKGCLLDCEAERAFEQNYQRNDPNQLVGSAVLQKKAERRKKRSYRHQYSSSRQEWFSAGSLQDSAKQGCGSCGVLKQIFLVLFSGNGQELSVLHEYSLSPDFVLKRRLLSKKDCVEQIQLFQPIGLSQYFEHFCRSNILCGRGESLSRLCGWMEECLINHENCPRPNVSVQDSTRPARLLDLTSIRRHSDSGIKLVDTVPGTRYLYACLSHRWDKAPLHRYQTSTANLSEFKDFLSLNDLPGNFSDAVAIARNLGIPFLWIDSLCIIQDGDAGEDKRSELAKMDTIYRNAYLTIAAVSSPNSLGGCFLHDKWPDVCFLATQASSAYLMGARVLDKKGQPSSISAVSQYFPLLPRAWVLQERLLSPRLLQCNYGEFSFECLQSSNCECSSNRLAPHWKLNGRSGWWTNAVYRQRGRVNQQQHLAPSDSYETIQYWKAIISLYMRLNLSWPSDVLSAIAGCAQVMASHLNFHHTSYVAGMWKETLATDLLWYVKFSDDNHGASPLPRPKETTVPTWSWASVAMGQTIVPWSQGDWLAKRQLLKDTIQEVHCEPISLKNPFDKLKEAYLTMDAMLYPWYIRHFCALCRYRWADLYVERPRTYKRSGQPFGQCTTDLQPLEIDDLEIECYLDVRLREEGLTFQRFTSGTLDDQQVRCRLSEVHLLHAMHQEKPTQSLDTFLLLIRIPAVDGKSNSYRRIGLVKVRTKHTDVSSWEEIFQRRMMIRQERFYLL